ncbi:MAG: hypothetical protein ACOXZ4_03905 [Sphaerochaetaceae bacterium]|jgi:hypothetical protein
MKSQEQRAIQNAIRFHLDTYPGGTLIDLYKSFFQDQYGPGHLLEDRKRAWNYFSLELDGMKSQNRHTGEPCGAGRSFYRLPLDLVLDDIINKNDYFEAFISSAKAVTLLKVAAWQQKWDEIILLIKEEKRFLPTFEEDLKIIDSLLSSGSYLISHSQTYRNLYDPHYRLFSIKEMNSLKYRYLG